MINLHDELLRLDPSGLALVLWDRDVVPRLEDLERPLDDKLPPYLDGAGRITVHFTPAIGRGPRWWEFACDPVPHWRSADDVELCMPRMELYEVGDPQRAWFKYL